MAAFTTIAAASGLALSGATAGVSFARGVQQRKKARDADIKAQRYLDEAEKNITDRYAALGISKTPYKQESDALIAAGAQLTQAAAEGDQRGVGATAGKIYGAQTNAQAGIRDKMTQDVQGLKQLKAQKGAEFEDRQNQITMGRANQMFNNANALRDDASQSFQQGIQATTDAVKQGIALVPTFGGGEFGRAQRQYNRALDGDKGSTQAIQDSFKEMYDAVAKGNTVGAGYDLIKSKAGASQNFADAWEQINTGTYKGGSFDDFLTSYFTADDLNTLRGTL